MERAVVVVLGRRERHRRGREICQQMREVGLWVGEETHTRRLSHVHMLPLSREEEQNNGGVEEGEGREQHEALLLQKLSAPK